MAISGGIKFFRKSFVDIDHEEVVVTASTGTANRNGLRDRNRLTRWESSGSDDATTETLEIEFGSSRTIDRLLIVRHNWKAFTVKYWNGATWTHFASVVTKEGSQTNITETVCTKATSYYEFTPVSTEKIKVEITTTQTVDAEKYVYELIATEEIGTLEGYPKHGFTERQKVERKESLYGKARHTRFDRGYIGQLDFQGYPKAVDHALILELWEDGEDFLIYPCGGNADQFRFPMIGNRLEDVFLVALPGDFSPNYDQGVYVLPLSYSLQLEEVL